MRYLLRAWMLTIATLFLLDRVFTFVSVPSTNILLLAGSAFFILNTIGRPILKILWLPINVITLGLFSWALDVVIVFAITQLVPGFVLTPFNSPAILIGKILIPEIHLQMIWTYLFFSFLFSQGNAFLDWLFSED